MKQEYIILRDPHHSRNRSLEHTNETDIPEIEIQELSLDEMISLRAQPDVAAMTANMPIELNSSFLPGLSGSDEGIKSPCHWGIEAIGARETTLDGEGMIAGLLDTGIDRSHPAFWGMDIVEKDFTGLGLEDENGHGTHSAATIFGQPVEGRDVGVAPGIERALVAKILDENGEGECWHAIEALCWAASLDANVVTLSFRLSFTRYVSQLIESGYPGDVATAFALEAYHTTVDFFKKYVAILRVRSEALVIIAGAGDSTRKFENLAWERLVEAPARIPGIISVGALQEGENGYEITAFSNAGPTGVAPGAGIASADVTTGKIVAREGTCMAANLVAGAALLWGEFLEEWDDLTSFTLETKLKHSGSKEMLELGYRDVDVGCGLMQAPLEESERNLIFEDEEAETQFQTNIGKILDLSTFDINAKTRKKREELSREKIEKQFRKRNP